MTIELKVPAVGESIQEVQIGRWLKQPGDAFDVDESLVELETDKASMEIPAPAAGVLSEIVKREGESVAVGDTIAYLEEAERGKKDKKDTGSKQADSSEGNGQRAATAAAEGKARQDETAPRPSKAPEDEHRTEVSEAVPMHESNLQPTRREPKREDIAVSPSARRALREHGLNPEDIEGAGKRLRAEDVEHYVEKRNQQSSAQSAPAKKTDVQPPTAPVVHGENDKEQLVPMSLIRKRIAKRLVEAQHTAALLTTFNEIDMSAVMQLRKTHGERFQERYGVKLGFMSFFVKALIDSLKQTPALNAEIRDGDKIAYRNYYHIGVAVGGGQGLVVPVLRHAQRLSFAEIEKAIGDFAKRAQQKQLKPQELEGGTFTISNGGVYGSLLSTPIINPPQSGVLGMHTIQERPVARNGEVVIRPMMYVALTYDHRIVDGSDAVTFLRRIKDAIEDPARMLIEA